MGIQRTQEDSWTKEMAKWEQRPVLVNGTFIEPIPVAFGGRGGADRTEFPKMVYRAESADGGPRIAGFQIAKDEAHERQLLASGYFAKQEDAIAGVHAQQREFARLAANRAHNDKWMGEKAKAEAQAVDESTIEHLPSIPETPIKPRKKPGPKPRVQ